MMYGFTVVMLGAAFAMGCASQQGQQGTAAGEVVTPINPLSTVVVHVTNSSSQSMELRAIVNGHSRFIGSVGARDSTNIVLDPTLFPTTLLYLAALPADDHGRAVVGPLAASRGNRIDFTVESALDMSKAVVIDRTAR